MFSATQYEHAIDKIRRKIPEITQHTEDLQSKINRVLQEWYIVSPVSDLLAWLTSELIKLAEDVLEFIAAILASATAPIRFFQHAYQWESLRGGATTVAGDVNAASLGSTGDWGGAAANAYTQAIAPQSAAAAQLATLADKTSSALSICADAGLAFYVTVAGCLVAFISSQIVACAAATTGAGAPPALFVSLASGAFTYSTIVGALGALLALVGSQEMQLSTLHGQVLDNSAFPGGHWPVAAKF